MIETIVLAGVVGSLSALYKLTITTLKKEHKQFKEVKTLVESLKGK